MTNAIFDNIYIYNTTGAGFTANDAGIEYVNIILRNSEITNANALSQEIILLEKIVIYSVKFRRCNRSMGLSQQKSITSSSNLADNHKHLVSVPSIHI